MYEHFKPIVENKPTNIGQIGSEPPSSGVKDRSINHSDLRAL